MKPFKFAKSGLFRLVSSGNYRLILMIITIILFILAAGAPGSSGGFGD